MNSSLDIVAVNTFIWVDIVFIPNDGNRSCSTQRFAYLAVLIGSSDYRQVIIERDDEVIAVIIEKLKEFWKMVETNTPPSVRGMDNKLLTSLYPNSRPKPYIML